MLLSEIGAKVALGVGPTLAPRNPSDDVAIREGRQGLRVKSEQIGCGCRGDRGAVGEGVVKQALGRRPQVERFTH
jgi:hypothetical protein